ncbi:MAG TPA: VIT1/CCC1 transporter family protein [Acidimicrobiales bacterium]|nr:VIT1/CCC1 transporter family protein [Acidimicrobiales bacterium]
MPDEHPHHHRSLQGGGARAAVFGISDGLVSNVALILGMAGAHTSATSVRLAGLAGLVGGAFSMAAGEYVSMRAQTELMQRELRVERDALHRQPEGERRELTAIYERRGLESDLAAELASEMMRDPETALETHAREELGINPHQLGNPFQAAASSFVMFAIGAFLPLVPWLFTSGTAATWASVIIAGIASLVVGGALSFFTGKPWLWSACRQLLISGVAAGVTFTIGRIIG